MLARIRLWGLCCVSHHRSESSSNRALLQLRHHFGKNHRYYVDLMNPLGVFQSSREIIEHLCGTKSGLFGVLCPPWPWTDQARRWTRVWHVAAKLNRSRIAIPHRVARIRLVTYQLPASAPNLLEIININVETLDVAVSHQQDDRRSTLYQHEYVGQVLFIP